MRVEFFFKSQVELSALVNFMKGYHQPAHQSAIIATSKLAPVQLITDNVFSRFNLANKVKNDNLLVSAKNIINVMPDADVCIHYSLKYNSQKSVEQSFSYFNGFLTKAEEIGVKEVMIISGSGDKKALNTVSCLQMLRDSDKHSTPIEFGVAFNPYFPDAKMRAMEVDRLHAKLSTGMVSTVYLQFGSDTNLLEEGLKEIQNAISSYENSATLKKDSLKKIKVSGSVMIPSKVLLARMKFRPWNGVFLSELFLSEVPAAEKIVLKILSIYKTFGVEPLVETAFKTDSDASHILKLLSGIQCTKDNNDADLTAPMTQNTKSVPILSQATIKTVEEPRKRRNVSKA